MDVAAAPYGLPIPSSSSEEVIGQLAYFSNSPLNNDSSNHPVAIIGIHGSGRDARAMFHRLMTTVKQRIRSGCDGVGSNDTIDNKIDDEDLTTYTEQDNFLVITPWFLCPADDCPPPPSLHGNGTRSLPYLRWIDDPVGSLQIEHSFRYGAESIPPINNDDDITDDYTTMKNNATVSSYFVMDVLLETLCNRSKYPNLSKIIVVGHSAGGQLVHRWGLMSGSWCFGDDDTNVGFITKTDDDITASTKDDITNYSMPSIRLVVANPRSFTYLDRRRYLPNTTTTSPSSNDDHKQDSNALEFRLPTNSEVDECPYYNRYMWGIEDNPDLPAPYITKNIERLMKTVQHSHHCDSSVTTVEEALFCRYASRDVVYLAGENDTQIVEEQISCGDGYQGQMRRDRSERYHSSLQMIGKEIFTRLRQDVTMGKDEEWSRFITRFHSTHTDGEEIRIHRRLVVKDVGHEGGRMWKSDEGRMGMFD